MGRSEGVARGFRGGQKSTVADQFGLSGGVSVLQGSRYPRSEVSEDNFPLTSETQKAIDAVRFIAAHLKNEDDYAEVLCEA